MGRFRYLPPVIVICTILGVVAVRTLWTGAHHYSDSAIMMDTVVEISVWGKGRGATEAAVDSAFLQIARVDSLFRGGLMETGVQMRGVPAATYEELISISRQAYGTTEGKFDPTIGMVSRLWSFWDGASPPSADSLARALQYVGFSRYLAKGASGSWLLDLGGIAKGYAVDLAAEKLRVLGISSAIINAGGDLRLIGSRPDGEPWRIAIRHPRKAREFIGYLDVENAGVATSGDYEKCFFHDGKRYHHILDPETGMPGYSSNSVTVVGPGACLSDALATGLFILGPERGMAVVEATPAIDAVFVFAEGESLVVSSGLADRFVRADTE